MAKTNIVTLDLKFQGTAHAIAAYLIKHSAGAVLIECGPGSTIGELKAGLAAHGLTAANVTHVLLTHIHLDHAGAAGWLAQQGAQIIVHPNGAPHLRNPDKLLASARRIYADKMGMLWGEFLPVQPGQIRVPTDGEEVVVGNLRFVPFDTPGHADHHYSYLFEDTCFTGDFGGVRLPGYQYLRVPMPPPELHFEKWRASVRRLRQVAYKQVAPTHFGLYDDPAWQFRQVEQALDEAETWLEKAMPANPPLESLRQQFVDWMNDQGRQQNLKPDVTTAYELANPLGMSADGMFRYWNKVRMAA
jgi:glyoxylase-like metal-dependent hydrolase (beta-lactamase superfamily II)